MKLRYFEGERVARVSAFLILAALIGASACAAPTPLPDTPMPIVTTASPSAPTKSQVSIQTATRTREFTATPRAATATATVTWSPVPPTRPPSTATATVETASDELVHIAGLLYARFDAERAKQNIAPLKIDPLLEAMARERSEDMIARDYLSHQDPDTGQGLVGPLFAKYNYNAGIWGENFVVFNGEAASLEDIADLLAKTWLDSEGHARNILNPDFHRTGIALARSADGLKIIATQLFAN